jgi:hypothetical protein
MKTSSIFWGVLLISIGILFMLGQFGMINNQFDFAINIWPLVLVFWGISFLNISPMIRKIIAGLAAIILSFFIISIFHHNWISHFSKEFDFTSDCEEFSDSLGSKHINVVLDSTYLKATLDLDAGAGMFTINDSTSNVIDIFSALDPIFKMDTINHEYTLHLAFNKPNIKWKNHRSNKSVDIKLNPALLWDINLNTGASAFECNLSNFKINNAIFKAGAASLEITLGVMQDSARYKIDAGASSVEISIPDSAGCEIIASTGLSSKEFSGFTEITSGRYQTSNFNGKNKKIFIDITGGVSSFEVTRY